MGTWIEILDMASLIHGSVVVPLVGTWIEITTSSLVTCAIYVVPLVGTWIEIAFISPPPLVCLSSFPLWERGLKSQTFGLCNCALRSFPLWERGLKFKTLGNMLHEDKVVPLVGTWIEIVGL